MTLKTGIKCKFKDIGIGEVFAYDGCITIAQKCDDDDFIILGLDITDHMAQELIGEYFSDHRCFGASHYFVYAELRDEYVYELPRATQRLWKEE